MFSFIINLILLPFRILISIYSIPGFLGAKWDYLFPKKGDAVRTARQRNSKFAYFVNSTYFYMLIAFIYLWMMGL